MDLCERRVVSTGPNDLYINFVLLTLPQCIRISSTPRFSYLFNFLLDSCIKVSILYNEPLRHNRGFIQHSDLLHNRIILLGYL